MTENFLRQRRNLFIVNGIIIFAFYAKVNISKLTLAGISFSGFGNPTTVYHFLWVVMAYFLYRFTIFFIEDEKGNFFNMWTIEMAFSTEKKLKNLALKNSGSFNEDSMLGYYQVKSNNWTIRYQKESERDELGEWTIENIELPISRMSLWWPQLSAILKFSLLTSALTNYILPLIISFYVIFKVGFSSWEGAFVNMFT